MNVSASAPPSPACLVRPPWPDELPRIADAFPRGRVNRALHPLVLVAPGSPERMVGFAGVLEPLEGQTGLTCALRPRYLDSPDGDRLLSAAVHLARSLGARSIRTIDDLPSGSPIGPALKRAGFVVTATSEFWKLEIPALARRLGRSQVRLASDPRLGEFEVEPPGPADLPGVQTLLADAGLLSPERRRALSPSDPGTGYTPALSAVVRQRGQVVAVALLKTQVGAAVVDALVVDPSCRRGFHLPVHLALRHCTQACLAAGLSGLVFAADRERAKAALRIARRSGGRLAGGIEIFSQPLEV